MILLLKPLCIVYRLELVWQMHYSKIEKSKRKSCDSIFEEATKSHSKTFKMYIICSRFDLIENEKCDTRS